MNENYEMKISKIMKLNYLKVNFHLKFFCDL